jgi:hypothetical protein
VVRLNEARYDPSAFEARGIRHHHLEFDDCCCPPPPVVAAFLAAADSAHSAGGAVAVLQLVPGCGSLVAVGWALVCYCIGFSRVHGLTTGRAAVVVLLPMLLCCAVAGLFAAGVGFFAART